MSPRKKNSVQPVFQDSRTSHSNDDFQAEIDQESSQARTLNQIITERKHLFKRMRICADLALIVALVGLGCAVANEEIRMAYLAEPLNEFEQPYEFMSLLLEICSNISSIALAIIIGFHYIIKIKIKEVNRGLRDWRLVISKGDIFYFLLEITVASINPYFIRSKEVVITQMANDGTYSTCAGFRVHTVLTVLMFSRVYLLARWAVLHHNFTNNSLTHIFGRINAIDLSLRFVFKAILQEYPWVMLFGMILITYAIGGWSMRACETLHQKEPLTEISNALWLVIITHLTVG